MDVQLNEDAIESLAEYVSDMSTDIMTLQQQINSVQSLLYSMALETVDLSLEESQTEIDELQDNLALTMGFLIKSRDFENGNSMTIYDSFHGVENSAGFDLLSTIFGKTFQMASEDGLNTKESVENVNKKTKAWAKRLEQLTNVNKNGASNAWTKGLENQFALKMGEKYDKDYKFGKNEKFAAINVIDKSAKYSGQLMEIGLDEEGNLNKIEGKYGSYGGSIRVGTLDASAGFQAGVDHITASASATVTGATAHGEVHTKALTVDGLDVLSAGIGGDVSALYATASAKAGMGAWTDSKGEKHHEFGAQLKAEADLVRAEAKADVNVAGVTGEAKLGVKVGVGAQADFGIVDGEVKCNLSLAVGVGFDVGFSLNFNKLGNWVSDKIKNSAQDYTNDVTKSNIIVASSKGAASK